ncbi:hypothetical protein [Nereida sp. MMG025]|uniref:RipA family octameric membrane protein n=1 Tax=Nereida sp. MMG025 TaxID=2909981 RepID=UPI001F3E011D|nr:hypothetical protein [Nereida sp. MMG025]MCF6444503.1 hypothetical protein [Nereida sp. MMG025]
MLTDIYETYVDAAMLSEGKRQTANQAYLSLSLAIVTASSSFESFPLWLAASMVVFISLIWFATIWKYRQLARIKFEVIVELEKQLEFAPFTKEWGLTPKTGKLFGLTRLEKAVPITLGGLATAYLIWTNWGFWS